MRIALFCHSLQSDWNHGNAHFLRGVITELASRGHHVTSWEPAASWSASNLEAEYGADALRAYRQVYPGLPVSVYDPETLDLDSALQNVDLALVHEWNEPGLVKRIGEVRARLPRLRVFFHDTHHRMVTDPNAMARYDLSNYDGVLAFGESVSERYRALGSSRRVWTWHEAADTRIFRPLQRERAGDVVWIGNWGDEERTEELNEFFIDPVSRLNLNAEVFGVRYPPRAVSNLSARGIHYRGWTPNYRVPEIYARFRFTVHVPRRPYAQALAGVPTIRVFEVLACGIPLISAPWNDSECLFPEGAYLKAANGEQMTVQMKALISDESLARELSARGRASVLARHTCAHRVDELLGIYEHVRPANREVAA